QQLDAAGLEEVYSHEAAARLQVGQEWRPPADAVDVVERELDPHLRRESGQVERRVGGAAAGRDRSDRVLERLFRQDLRGPQIVLQDLESEPAGLDGRLRLALVHGRNRVVADGG